MKKKNSASIWYITLLYSEKIFVLKLSNKYEVEYIHIKNSDIGKQLF